MYTLMEIPLVQGIIGIGSFIGLWMVTVYVMHVRHKNRVMSDGEYNELMKEK